MRWYCTGHFAATWLVCTSLIFYFQRADNSSVAFILFGVILWPVLLWALPLKGYFHLKAITLDRLKARVRHGDLKKAVVFAFGFCTSLLASATIAGTALAVRAVDGWFRQQEGVMSLAHTVVWFPVAFALWVFVPKLVLARLAHGGNVPEPVEKREPVAV